MIAVVCSAIITLCTIVIASSVSYRMGLEEACRILDEETPDTDHRILDICTVYAQDGYTASEAMEMITGIVLE